MAMAMPTSSDTTGTNTIILLYCEGTSSTVTNESYQLPDPPAQEEPEPNANLRKRNRAAFRYARSDQKHREKWRYHRRSVRFGKAELKREKARNKLRQRTTQRDRPTTE